MAGEITTAPAVQEGSALNVSEYLSVFKKRKWTILIPVGIFLVIGGVAAKLIPPRYEITTRLKIADPGVGRDISNLRVTAPPHKPMLSTALADIKNRPFLEPIIKDIGLNEGYDLSVPKNWGVLFEYMKKNLTVKLNPSEKGPDTMDLVYIGRDRIKSGLFLNGIRERYIENFKKEYRGAVRTIYEQLTEQRNVIAASEAEERARYEAFQNDPDFKLINAVQAMTKNLSDLQQKKVEIGIEITEKEAELKNLGDSLLAEKPTSETTNLRPNPKKKDAEAAVLAAKSKFEDLQKRYTPLVKQVQDALREYERLQAAYKELPDSVVESTQVNPSAVHVDLQKDRAVVVRILEGKRIALRDVAMEIEKITKTLERVRKLDNERAAYQGRIDGLSRRRGEIGFKFDQAETAWLNVSGAGAELFTVLDWPNTDSDPVFPNLLLFLLIGAGAGFLFGTGIAFIREFASLTFTSPDQVAMAIPVRILGAVSHIESPGEIAEKKTRQLRSIAVFLAIGVALAALHAAYFNDRLVKRLPSAVVKIMDKIYGGKTAKGR